MEEANLFLPSYIDDFNKRFSVVARSSINAHRPLPNKKDLEKTFTWQEERTLSNSLTVQYNKILYIVEPDSNPDKFRKAKVKVYEYEDGRIDIRCKGQSLKYRTYDKQPQINQGAIVENKRLGAVLAYIQEKQKTLPQTGLKRATSNRKGFYAFKHNREFK